MLPFVKGETYPVSFSYLRLYSNGKPHKGKDYGCPQGTRLTAPIAGTVKYAGFGGGWGSAYGGQVIIEYRWLGKTRWIILAHMSQIDVKIGQTLKMGQVIGRSGGRPGTKGAGNSTGSHVHVQANKSYLWSDHINPEHVLAYTGNAATKPAYTPLPASFDWIVRTKTLNVRDFPHTGFSKVTGTIKMDDRVASKSMAKVDGQWWLELTTGGWIAMDYVLATYTRGLAARFSVTVNVANLRERADADARAVGSLKKGDAFISVGSYPDSDGVDWYMDSQHRWIRSDLVAPVDIETPDPTPVPPVVVEPVRALDQYAPSEFGKGKQGNHILLLGQALVDAGFDRHYRKGPSKVWGVADQENVKDVQIALGYTGSAADGFPGKQTLKYLANNPKPVRIVDATSLNRADYDSKGTTPKKYGGKTGMATRAKRTPDVVKALLRPKSLWLHVIECDSDQVAAMTSGLKGYTRVVPRDTNGKAVSGKGRQSWFLSNSGIRIIEARLHNVSTMLDDDTKEFLVIAYEIDGYQGIEVVAHNENQKDGGKKIQQAQFYENLVTAERTAARLGIKKSNIHYTADVNLPSNEVFARTTNWSDIADNLEKVPGVRAFGSDKKSTNGWKTTLVKGERIDLDAMHDSGIALSYEQDFTSVVSDHWPHRAVYALTK